MGRPNPKHFFAVLALALVLIGGAELLKGGLYFAKHEGDMLHLVDIVSRMANGQRIHQDFMTPIGVLAFAPITAFFAAGIPIGKALILGQLAIGLVLLPAIWWVARRLAWPLAYLLGLYLVALTLALSYDGTDVTLSLSVHYNRWAWVLAYLALVPALLPAEGRRGALLDGLLIGTAMATLALLKVTYFLALAVPVTLAMAMLPSRRSLWLALAAGLAVALLATLWGGIGFWLAYIGDLVAVATSPLRTQPGLSIDSLISAPSYLPLNLLLLLCVVLLRQAQEARVGLVLLTLLPAILYIEWQNFDNDPQWLVLLAVLMLALRPNWGWVNGWGWDLRLAFTLAAAAAIVFALPGMLSFGLSAGRHLGVDAADYEALIPDNPRFADLRATSLRLARVDAMVPLDRNGSGLEALRDRAGRTPDEVSIAGTPLRQCALHSGLVGWYRTVADELTSAGYAGRRIYEADLLNALWLFGAFPPLQGVAPWYYGGVPGLADAELVLVPDCPISPASRKTKIEAIAAAGYRLEQVRETPLYRLYALTPPG